MPRSCLTGGGSVRYAIATATDLVYLALSIGLGIIQIVANSSVNAFVSGVSRAIAK